MEIFAFRISPEEQAPCGVFRSNARRVCREPLAVIVAAARHGR
jgi:hypothetical protein